MAKPGVQSFDFEFDVMATSDKQPNTGKIVIYNLSETTRNFLSGGHQGIELFAGYGEEEPPLIFRGATTNVVHDHLRPDWSTTIYAGDGDVEYQGTPFERTYTAGTQIRVILADIATAMGIPAEIDFLDPFAVLLGAESYSGRAKETLDKLTAKIGYQWSIQQGKLEIKEIGFPVLSDPVAVLLSVDTGLIGSPTLIERQDTDDDPKRQSKLRKKRKKRKQRIIGVRAKSLMNAAIKPGRLILIQAQQTVTSSLGKLSESKTPSVTANGVWLVDRAHYYGNNTKGPFYVEPEADVAIQQL